MGQVINDKKNILGLSNLLILMNIYKARAQIMGAHTPPL